MQTLNVNDLLEYKDEQEVLYASNSKNQLRLYILLDGSYRVELTGTTLLKTMQPSDAIELFNELS